MEDLGRIELALLEDPSVADCAILTCNRTTSCAEIVAYVVPGESFMPDRLRSRLEAVLPKHLLPCAYVSVSSIPLTPGGQVDEQVLSAIGVMDADLVLRWEDQLRAVPGIERVAVRVEEEVVERPSVSHLSDLLPGWKTAARTSRQETAPARTTSPLAKSPSPTPQRWFGGGARDADFARADAVRAGAVSCREVRAAVFHPGSKSDR